MPEKSAVEKFKITPNMKGFLKTYKRFNEVGARLRSKMEIQLGEAAQTRQMLQQIEKGMQMLMVNAPQQPTFEIEGQEPQEQMAQGQMAQEQMPQEEQTMDPSMNY